MENTVKSEELSRLEQRLESALAEIERLKALEAIRDCIYRVCRGIDRIDEELIRSAFHADATVDFGSLFSGGAEKWFTSVIEVQKAQSQAHHMVGNIIIKIDGEEAVAESYELARHKSPINGELCDLVLAMRTLDRFSLRHGEWKISERTKVMDWGRIITGEEGIYDNSPMQTGCRDNSDASYQLF